MKKTLKRFLSMLLVSCMAFSMVAGAEGNRSADTTNAFVQEMTDGTLHYFENDNWRYSVSILNDGRALFCAIDKQDESIIYQKFFDEEQLITNSSTNDNNASLNVEDIAIMGFDNIEEADVINVITQKSNEGAAPRAEDPIAVELKSKLQGIYGTDYNDNLKYTANYSGKIFDLKETQVSGAAKLDTKVFDAGVTIASIITAFVIPSATVVALAKILSVAAGLSTVVGFTSKIDRYGCSTVRTRDAYTTGVGYMINSTWMEYGYIGLNNITAGNTQPPELVYDAMSYQHSQSYFDNYQQQVQDAYRNYFG